LEIDRLELEYRSGLVNCQDKNIVTPYPAFLYLAKDYGLNQKIISGLSYESEPSSQQLTNVGEFVKDNNVKYIFFDKLININLAKMATTVGIKTLILNPIEGLSKEEIEKGYNYFTEMRNNLFNLKIGLQCQ
jgi:zinc transport system substrate-binding protein